VQVVTEGIDSADPSQTAELLVAALRRLESPELVLAGRQAGDWDHGQVGYLVAERLGWPAVGLVWHAEAQRRPPARPEERGRRRRAARRAAAGRLDGDEPPIAEAPDGERDGPDGREQEGDHALDA